MCLKVLDISQIASKIRRKTKTFNLIVCITTNVTKQFLNLAKCWMRIMARSDKMGSLWMFCVCVCVCVCPRTHACNIHIYTHFWGAFVKLDKIQLLFPQFSYPNTSTFWTSSISNPAIIWTLLLFIHLYYVLSECFSLVPGIHVSEHILVSNQSTTANQWTPASRKEGTIL